MAKVCGHPFLTSGLGITVIQVKINLNKKDGMEELDWPAQVHTRPSSFL